LHDDTESFFVFTGIAAANYSHVKYFASRENYDFFYTILLCVFKIGLELFALVVQQKLVDRLAEFDPKASAWYCDNRTGAMGRYCVCHACYCGSNNNMGVKVDDSLRVPDEYVAAVLSARKKAKM
jgi:hypothetical protein